MAYVVQAVTFAISSGEFLVYLLLAEAKSVSLRL